jgi:hypothetical protein
MVVSCKRKMLGSLYTNWIARSEKVKSACYDDGDDDNNNNDNKRQEQQFRVVSFQRRLIAGLSSQMPRFQIATLHKGYLVEKWH